MITKLKATKATENPAEQVGTLDAEIAALTAALDEVNAALGAAFARQRTGDPTAATDVGRLSLKRSSIESGLRDLSLTVAALRPQAEEWQRAEAERLRAAQVAEIAAAEKQARTLEAQLVDQLLAAAETAKALSALYPTWKKLHAEGAVPVDPAAVPRNPSGLLSSRLLSDPGAALGAWQARGRSSGGTAPRQLFPRNADRLPAAKPPTFVMPDGQEIA